MKKLIALTVGVLVIGLTGVIAEEKKEGEQKKPTAEQKQLRKDMVKKYDANKDGKLDKEEKAKISADDKKKLKDAGIGGDKKKEGEGKREGKKKK